MLLYKLTRSAKSRTQEYRSEPDYLKVSEEHQSIINKLLHKQIKSFKKFFHNDPQELEIKVDGYSICKEYENFEFCCYSLYKGTTLLRVLYKEDINNFLTRKDK